MNSERRHKNIVIVLLCTIIALMGIGFATLRSEIKIEGGAALSNTWNVQITNIEVLNKSENANAGEPTFNATAANFSATLSTPGDFVTYKITVTNSGSIDATLTSVEEGFESLDTEAISYTLAPENPSLNAKLASGSTLTFVVTATYKANAVGENAPTESEKSKDFSLQLTYNQDLTA